MNRYEVKVYNLVDKTTEAYLVNAVDINEAIKETKRYLDEETECKSENHEIYAVELKDIR